MIDQIQEVKSKKFMRSEAGQATSDSEGDTVVDRKPPATTRSYLKSTSSPVSMNQTRRTLFMRPSIVTVVSNMAASNFDPMT